MNQQNNINVMYKIEKNGTIDIIISFIKLIRVRQWTKNIFLFSGLIFATSFNFSQLVELFKAFILFCGISSCVYILNDIIDCKKDVIHPVKRLRPIASGKIKVKYAIILLCMICPVTLLFSFILNKYFGVIVTLYLIINIFYSIKLKEFVFVDLIIISTGFIIRTISGILVVEGEICFWFLMSVAFLTLYLGMNKRKKELQTLAEESKNHRKNLSKYTISLINEIIPTLTACTIIAYCIHILYEVKINFSFITIPFVIYGILRYQYLTNNEGYGESPEQVLLKDKPIFFTILLCGAIYISAKLISTA